MNKKIIFALMFFSFLGLDVLRADNNPCVNAGVYLMCSMFHVVKNGAGETLSVSGGSEGANLVNFAEPFNPKDCKAEVMIESKKVGSGYFTGILSDSLNLRGTFVSGQSRHEIKVFRDEVMKVGKTSSVTLPDQGFVKESNQIYQLVSTTYTCEVMSPL